MTKNVSVSEKSTKSEILEAYNDLLAKIREQKAADQKTVKAESEKVEVVKSASRNSMEDIVRRLADLKLELVKNIDHLEEKLIAEYKRFVELQQAIAAQDASLEEMYAIQAEAGSLTALILAQKEKKASFETEMEQKKADFDAALNIQKQQWKKEQEDFELSRKERDVQLKKERQRDEDEYSYNLKLQRKKDGDAYETQKAALEKELTDRKETVERELSEREAILSTRERELDELKAKVEAFPKELDKLAKDTEKSITEKIELKYKYQTDLAAKEIEGESKLSRQTIEALEGKIKEQEEQIRQLTQKADDSIQQVQTIAVKAIEGASAQRLYTERTKENG